MFCKFCGKEINNGKDVCDECSTSENDSKESFQGTEVIIEETKDKSSSTYSVSKDYSSNNNNDNNSNGNNNNNNNNAYNYTGNNATSSEAKSKLAAGLFGIFLGSIGIHNFYLGYTGKAVAQLLITVCSCGVLSVVSGIWGLIEGIIILTSNDPKDAFGNDLRD